MSIKRSVFGTYVKDGVVVEREDAATRRKGFRTPPKRTVKLKNPFHMFNHVFNFNKDFTKVPTIVSSKRNRKKKYYNHPISNKVKMRKA